MGTTSNINNAAILLTEGRAVFYLISVFPQLEKKFQAPGMEGVSAR
jgi:hypothetical protein